MLSVLGFPLAAWAWADMDGGTTENAAEGIDIKNPNLDIAIRNARRARIVALFSFLLLSLAYGAAVALAFPFLRPAFVAFEAPVVATPLEKVGPTAILLVAFMVTVALLCVAFVLASNSAAYRRIADVLELTKLASKYYLDEGRSEGFVLFLRNFGQERSDYERGLRTHPHLQPPLMIGTTVREAALGLAPTWVVVEAANLKRPPPLHRRYRASETLPSHLPISLYDRENWEETVAQWTNRARCIILHLNSVTDALVAEAAMTAASRRPVIVLAERGVWRALQGLSLPGDTPLLLYQREAENLVRPNFAITRTGCAAKEAMDTPATMTIDQMQRFLRDWIVQAGKD